MLLSRGVRNRILELVQRTVCLKLTQHDLLCIILGSLPSWERGLKYKTYKEIM